MIAIIIRIKIPLSIGIPGGGGGPPPGFGVGGPFPGGGTCIKKSNALNMIFFLLFYSLLVAEKFIDYIYVGKPKIKNEF